MSDAPVAAKGWWEGMKPVNFQWTVLRCDIQVAQELNRGGGKGHSGPTSGPITNFQAARKRQCPQNARRGGVLVQNKEGQNPPGDRWPGAKSGTDRSVSPTTATASFGLLPKAELIFMRSPGPCAH